MSKILEKLIYNRVVLLFLKKQNFFYKYQFGFRKNHSTNHATSLLIENIAEAFENKEHVLGVFLHLSKAGVSNTWHACQMWHATTLKVARELLPYFINMLQCNFKYRFIFYCCSIVLVKLVSGFHSFCTSILIEDV